MTDIAASPVAASPIATPHATMPRLLPRLGATLRDAGITCLRLPGSIGRAFAMAYVDPYAGQDHREVDQRVAQGDGRDPTW